MNKGRLICILSLVSSLWLLFCSPHTSVRAASFEVGPGKAYLNIGDVPWESLGAGDTVLIHWRAEPYKEKWVICRQGTAAAPISIRGVPGPAGELPVIDGNGATTRTALNYWSEVRGVIKVGGANIPADTTPRFIIIENLDIRSARPPYTFTSAGGATQTYTENASPIYIEKGESITIRNCVLHDAGNGLFVASSDELASRDILVEGNYIYDNGIVNSIFQHNNYTAAVGITFQYNRFGPLRAGCLGNNLKDRSAGLVVRYNWIEGGNRQLDLVDGEDSSLIRTDPLYRETHVYGNILIEHPGTDNRQIAHYGGDSGTTANYRKGVLYFYNNHVISNRTDRTTLFRLSTNQERCDARNNIFYVSAAGNTLSLLDSSGVLDLTHNWLKPGWVNSFGTVTGTINNDGTSITGSAPGFINEAGQDYHLAETSACVNAGTALNANVIPAHSLARQYVMHRGSQARPNDGAFDVGAFELHPASHTIGLYRPGDQTFYLRNTNSNGFADLTIQYGGSGDLPIVGDWDGNGTATIGVFRPSNNTFHLRNSNSPGIADLTIHYGAPGDIPIVGDWDGSGTTTIGVYRPSNSTFYLRNSNSPGFADVALHYGASDLDIPVVGDWDGNGTWTVGVYRPSESAFYLRNSNTQGFHDLYIVYGAANLDTAVMGDWDGNGTMTIGVYRSSTATFYLKNSNREGFADLYIEYGSGSDVPVAGDWDGLP